MPKLEPNAPLQRPETGALSALAVAPRDRRLDVFRGLALAMIFINHVPGTLYEQLTSRNFGFSDAAEAFVLMSGIAAGLAYSNRFRTGSLWLAVAKVWARARQLYFVHLATTTMALAIFALGAALFDLPQLLTMNNFKPLFQQPLAAIIGIPTLTHQLGYFNILPLYAVLLVFTPAFLLLGLRKPLLLLGLSVALWALAGQFRLNLPAYPNSGGWFFNPLSWQLLFVIGLLSGVGMKQGRALVPYNRWLFWAAAGFLLAVLVWVKLPVAGEAARSGLSWLSRQGVPFYLVWFDKTFLALPRLLHALALAYVLSSVVGVARLAESRVAQPLALLGRHGLPVFATGSVLCILLQAVKARTGSDPLLDGLLLAGGLGLQLALAWSLMATDRLAGRRRG